MPKIKILPDVIANKIAAGEVVERPASVVKELLENSVDAGATRITVELEDGGKRLIRVSDNGDGMSRDDALLSLERHATSKISDVKDIERIVTLGFRGEALPSIVSVSRAVITTRTDSEISGTRLVIDGGVLKDVTDTGRDRGTDVEIRNIFYNLPARRKFLRTESTELRYIKSIIYDAAVASPSLSITLMSNGRTIFSYHGADNPQDMLLQIFGKTMAGHFLPLRVEADEAVVEGFIGTPETARTSNFYQSIIVNGRPVRSKSISRGVFDGYGPMLGHGSYPPFILYIETDPSRVDVNIHPSKREIRMHREYVIVQALKDAVSRTVQTLRAAPTVERPVIGDNFANRNEPGADQAQAQSYGAWRRDTYHGHNYTPQSVKDSDQTALSFPSAGPSTQNLNTDPVQKPYVEEGPSFYQLKDRYIITTIKEGALIIDQHVAHERILYEEVLDQLRGRTPSSQQLLFPVTLDFSAADFDVMEQMLPFLNRIGFSVREFGERSVIIDAIPSGPIRFDDGAILREFIDEMRTHGAITSGYLEKFAAAVACRAAVKAGKPLNQTEMQYLIDRMFATKEPFVCPHGRPTVIRLTLDELDRRFGR